MGKSAKKSVKAKRKTARPAPRAKAKPARTPAKAVVRRPARKTVKAKAPAKAPPRKPSRKAPARSPARSKAPARAVAKAVRKPLKYKLGKKDLEFFRKQLLNLKDRLVDGISFLAGDNLGNAQREATGDLSNYGMHMADQGTDNFDREFALSLVSNEQEVLYEIEEALQRIDQGNFGVCEMTGQMIELERLKVLPYARYCIAAQQEMERNRRRFRSFAPHAPMPPGGEF